MTEDLVERLREVGDRNGLMYADYDTIVEAANRIEQLTERMQSSERVLNKVANGDLRLAKTMGAKVRYSPADDRLVERVRKMEYALHSIADTPIGAEIPDRTTIWGLATYMQETARDALAVSLTEPLSQNWVEFCEALIEHSRSILEETK